MSKDNISYWQVLCVVGIFIIFILLIASLFFFQNQYLPNCKNACQENSYTYYAQGNLGSCWCKNSNGNPIEVPVP